MTSLVKFLCDTTVLCKLPSSRGPAGNTNVLLAFVCIAHLANRIQTPSEASAPDRPEAYTLAWSIKRVVE